MHHEVPLPPRLTGDADAADADLAAFERGQRRWAIGTSVALAVALLIIGVAQRDEAPARGPQAGQLAPDFALTSFDGEPIRLAAYRGLPVVMNFWASWCPPCRAEAPVLRNVARNTQGRVVFIGIDVRDTASDARKFINDYDIPYLNGADVNGAVEDTYGGIGIPYTVFIAADGTIARTWLGPLDERRLLAFLEELA